MLNKNHTRLFFLLVGLYIAFIVLCQFVIVCSLDVKTIVKFSLVLFGFVTIYSERSAKLFYFSQVLLILFFLLTILMFVLEQFDINLEFLHLVKYIIFNVSTGYFEEFTFRFLLFFGLLKRINNLNLRSILGASIITSVVFALIHLLNLRHDIYALQNTVNQVVIAFGLGFLFQSLFIRYKSLFLVVTVHSAINFFGTYSAYFKMHEIAEDAAVTQGQFTFDWGSFLFVVGFTLLLIIPLGLFFFPVRKNYSNWFENFGHTPFGH